jgi:DNA-binding CsgD family transcriptional regulator
VLVVVESAHGYAFRHSLARDAVYDDLLPGERVRLHSAYADALAGRPELLSDTELSVAASLAHHTYAALDLPAALAASIAAAREAFTGVAPREALAQYERALSIWPRVPAEQRPADLDQAEVLRLAGEAAEWAGEVDRAVSLFEQALAELPTSAPVERRTRAVLGCARAYRSAGRLTASVELLGTTLDEVPAEPVTRERAEVLAALSGAYMRAADMESSAIYAGLATEAARQLGATDVEADAQITLGVSLAHLGRHDDGLTAARAGLDRAVADDRDAYTALRGYINLSDLLETLGRSREAVAVAEPGTALAQRAGMARTLGVYLSGNIAESLLHLGEWPRTRALLEVAEAGRVEGVFEATIQSVRAELSMLSGDLERARRAHARAMANVEDPTDEQFTYPLVAIEADLLRAASDFDAARTRVLDTLPAGLDTESASLLRYVWPLVWTGIRCDVAAVLAGRASGIDARLTGLAGTLPATTDPARAYRALCAAELGRPSGTGDWAAPVAAWRALSWPWPLAYSLLRAAEQLAEAGRPDAAAEALRESWTITRRLGARPLLAEVEQLAQRARIELGAAQPSAAPDPLAELGLTAREQEVLLLLAAGRTNPEIAEQLVISRKTASVHVSNILTKLGLRSRVQAAAVVHRLGLGETI